MRYSLSRNSWGSLLLVLLIAHTFFGAQNNHQVSISKPKIYNSFLDYTATGDDSSEQPFMEYTVIDDDKPEMFKSDQKEKGNDLPTTAVYVKVHRYHRKPYKTDHQLVSRRKLFPRRVPSKAKFQPKPSQNVIVMDNRFYQLSSSIALSLRVIVIILALVIPFFIINFIVIPIKLFFGMAMMSILNVLTLAFVLWDFLAGGKRKPHVNHHHPLRTSPPHWHHLPFPRQPDPNFLQIIHDDDLDQEEVRAIFQY